MNKVGVLDNNVFIIYEINLKISKCLIILHSFYINTMKVNFLLPFFLIFFFISNSQSHKNENAIRNEISFPDNVLPPVSQKERKMIVEVFGNKADEFVFKNEEFLKDIKHLLRNRIRIFEITDEKKQKKTKLLSQVDLYLKHNKNLQRDKTFDISTFNPLKYKLDFFANGTYLYKIDNTDYFIQITSQYRK